MSIFGKIVSAIRSLLQDRPMTRETVADQLDAAVAKHAEKLDWRHSVVDLMKALDQPSDLDARKDLAEDLGYQGALDGSAAMNTWLIEKMLQRLEDHYETVPGQSNERP